MKYNIDGGQLPVVICELEPGESMLTERGGMAWMTGSISMNTNMQGGFFKGIGRAFAGESMFMAYYTAEKGPGTVAFASSFPGSIVPIELRAGQSVICQKRSFLAGTNGLNIEIAFQKKLGVAFFGGEGFIMERITGPGIVFVEVDGAAIEYDLSPGQTFVVSTGNVAMIDESVSMDIKSVKGFKNVVFGGEGLFLTTLTGPGHICLQTIPISNLAQDIIPYLPSSSS